MADDSNLTKLLNLSKKLFNDTLSNLNKLANSGLGLIRKNLESLSSLVARFFADFAKKITEAMSKLTSFNNKTTVLQQSFNTLNRTTNFNSLKVSFNQINVVIMNAQKSVDNLGDSIDKSLDKVDQGGGNASGSLGKLKDGLNTISEIGQKLDFVNDINKTKVALEQMGVVDVDTAAASVHRLSKRMEEDPNKIAQVANAMTKQMGGSMDENIALLEQAVSKGANLNGDMLAKLQEAPASLNQMGMPVKDYLAIMAQVGKDGVLPDAIFSSLENGGLKFQEFGKIQEGVLNKIGMNQKDLEGKSTWDNLQTVLSAMDKAGLSIDEKQKGLNNLFKGAGEDGGKTLLDGLAKGVPNFDAMKEVDAPGTALKDITSGVESAVGDVAGPFVPYMQAIGPLVGLITSITSLTTLWTVAQGYLNVSLSLNPVGIIVIAIGVLLGLVALVIYKWDEWGESIMSVGGTVLNFLSNFFPPLGIVIRLVKALYNNWELIKQAFKDGGILGALKQIGITIFNTLVDPIDAFLNKLARLPFVGKLVSSARDSLADVKAKINSIQGPKVNAPGAKKEKEKEEATFSTNQTDLYNLNKNGKGKGSGASGDLGNQLGNNKTTADINKVTGQANQVKKIDIRIDAFNKGGINVTNAGGAGMSVDEVERWMKEMLNRIIIDADNALT